MTDYSTTLASLSPEKRKLLALLLKKQGKEFNSFPLSFSQQRLWFLHQFDPESPAYNLPAAVRLRGALDVAVLRRTLEEIVRRHEILRTTFATVDGNPVQVLSDRSGVDFEIVDLQRLSEDGRSEEILTILGRAASQPFDLERGPLFRARLYSVGSQEHILLLTMHHIISDGWSIGVMFRELVLLYRAFCLGEEPPLPKLPIQYADFAHWQREHLQGEILEKELEFWRRQLEGAPPVLELPTDRPRPAVQTNNGAHESVTLPHTLSQGMKQLARRERATPFMAYLAVFYALLYRYSGQNDLCVGTPIANRNRAETEGLIGFFVNTLVLRSRLSAGMSFRGLLQHVREVALEAYAHQDLPFEMLVERLQPDRDMSHSPLFQVMFSYEKAPDQSVELPGLTLEPLELGNPTTKFDLTLSILEEAGGLVASIEYNTDLFDRSTILRMLQHYTNLAESAVTNPDEPVSRLGMLSAAEEIRLRVEWNATEMEVAGRCIHELFEAQVARTPEALAVVFGQEGLTYRELDERANRLARYLRGLGVGPEVLVGLSVERSLELVVGLLGILKAGGAYVPLDPRYPQERLRQIMVDSGVVVVVTQEKFLQELPLSGMPVVCVDRDWARIEAESSERVESGVDRENLAYVIYTSGSTGRPKGVLIRHASVVNHNLAVVQGLCLDNRDRVLQFSTINFDTSVEEIFPTLLAGATLVMRGPEAAISVAELVELLAGSGVTVVDLPTAYWHQWVSELERGWSEIPESLRLVIVGGEKALAERYAAWRREVGGRVRVMNTYGPTETTVISTWYTLGEEDASGERELPIGRPIANTRVYILDEGMRLVPVGVTGELYIGGVGLARGYLGRPELTAERFVPDPFSGNSGARLYRTGDLARYREDGAIEFLGRADSQVKIRGFRVEPGEIESALVGHPRVRQAVVVAREEGAGQKGLVAYCDVGEDAESGIAAEMVAELRGYLRQKLPDYMVPGAFVLLPALPLSASGKVDSEALPEPAGGRLGSSVEYEAPRSQTEELLAGIWQELLGLERVGVGDNFFELGGHSLLATQMVSRIREAFGVTLPLRRLFEEPTVAGLAMAIEEVKAAGEGRRLPPLRRVDRQDDLPLSFAQQRLWFLDQLDPGSPLYNIPEAVRVRGPLDVSVLRRCLNEIVRRHEVLRTTFHTVDGKPKQVIASELDLPLPVVDLRNVPESEREAQALRLARKEAQRSFDLSKGPLVRATLLWLDQEEYIILFTMHHIISDNWSSNVLIQEMAVLYDAFSHGRSSPLPELPIQYCDFAHWQRQWLQGEALEAQISYWKERLQGLPPSLDLPTDRPRPPVQSFRGDYLSFSLPDRLSKAIDNLCRKEGVTQFMALLAAFQTLLHRYSRQEDIAVGTPIANRNRAEIEGLIGFFVNTLVLRTDLSGDPSFRELLRRVREVALEAYSHQDVPFEMLVEALKPERNLSQSPLFQVMFVFQNAPRRARQIPGLTFSPVAAHSGTAKFDLTMFVVEQDGRLSGALEYNTDLFERSTIERMVHHFLRLLEAAVERPQTSISSLPMLSDAERRQLLQEWSRTVMDAPVGDCVHRRFEAQVERTPDAPAVRLGETVLTYRELNARANRLAHHLQELGVRPEITVGLLLERSIEMMVAVLGVLKSGGAYVPLDPAYPSARLRFMIEDSEASVVLTREAFLEIIPEDIAQVVCLDRDWEQISRQSDDNPAIEIADDYLAYVIYTSGSTGTPKGTLITHGGLSNYLDWCLATYPVDENHGSLVHSTLAFDATVTALFTPLLVGATVTLLPEGIDVEDLSAALRQDGGFGLVKITPQHLQLLGQQVPSEAAAGLTRAFVIGGENLTADQIAFWRQHAQETLMFNEYGPTETVVGCVVYQITEDWQGKGSVPIGRVIPNAEVFVLDGRMEPVPVGVPGELFIGGAGVARGYLHRADLTAEKFVPHPFSDAPGARLYRSGDLVRYLPDGNLEFLGRVDDQVKIRGYRIEVGEVESVLAQHDAVRAAVVVARKNGSGEKRLVAYYVAEPGTGVTVSDLHRFLQQRLPHYMIPATFVPLDELPLTPNGKVDRRALPEPDGTRPDLGTEFVAPRTPKEQILAEIWAELLRVDRVGVHDNFFELGGDSILSIQVIARANQHGLRLTPKHIFQYPTVEGLAAVAVEAPEVHAEQGLVQGSAPLTPIQRWFVEQALPEPHHWNQSILLEVRDPLQPPVLAEVVRHLLVHHDALRTRFRTEKDGYEQWYGPLDEEVPFSHIDFSALSDSECSLAIETTSAELQASLDLTTGPLIRVAYFSLGPKRPDRLLIVIHHLVVDGVSWRILLEDLQQIYAQVAAGQEVVLPPKSTSFQYWAQRLSRHARSEELHAELEYWRQFGRREVAELPVDHPKGENLESSVESVTVSLSADETAALLRDVPSAYNTQINEALLTALVRAASRWIGKRSLLVEMEGHGREDIFEDVDLSRTVGWFTTLFPVRLDLGDSVTPGDALKGIKEQLRQVPRHGIGYGLLRYLHPDDAVRASLARQPQAAISFNYLGQFDQSIPTSGSFGPAKESRGPERSPKARRSHLIEILGGISGGELQVSWLYSRNLHERDTIETLASAFLEELRALIRYCQSPDAGGYTPSDFELAGLDEEKLNRIIEKVDGLA